MPEAVTFLSVAVEWALGAAAATLYFSRGQRTPERNARLTWRLFVASVAVLFAIALFMTGAQYTAWKTDPFLQNFLPPYQSILYFVKYAGTHFWLAPIVSFIVSGAFYGFLKLLKRENEQFFEEGEMELGTLAALLAGWPRVIVFLPAVFLAVVLIAGIKMALRRGTYTTLGLPFLIGFIITLIWGYAVLQALGLESLAVIPGAR